LTMTMMTGVTMSEPASTLEKSGINAPWRYAIRRAFQLMRRCLSGNGWLIGDDADCAFVDIEKNLVSVAFDADHGTELVRGDDDLARADLDSVVGQTAAVVAARHHALKHVLGLLERPAAELHFARANDELTGFADRNTVGAAAGQDRAVEVRYHDLPVDQHRAADEGGDELMRRPVVDIVRRRVLQDLAALHDDNVIRDDERLLLIVRDVDRADVDLLDQFL